MLAQHSAVGSANTQLGVQRERPSLYDLVEEMRRLSVPTLILHGDEDWPCLNPGILMKQNIASAALAVMPNCGDTINLEEPDEFNRSAGDFIVQVERSLADARSARSLELDHGKTEIARGLLARDTLRARWRLGSALFWSVTDGPVRAALQQSSGKDRKAPVQPQKTLRSKRDKVSDPVQGVTPMLILHILRLLRIVARLRKRRRKAAELLVRLDRRTLTDIGIGPGTMVSLAREAGVHGLRRPPDA
jgi:uncharacterized protein YjiS (DUF1127 family)